MFGVVQLSQPHQIDSNVTAGERTTSPRVSEFNSTQCTGTGSRICSKGSVGKQVDIFWNAYLSSYVIVHRLRATDAAKANYKMIHGNPMQGGPSHGLNSFRIGSIVCALWAHTHTHAHTYLKHFETYV